MTVTFRYQTIFDLAISVKQADYELACKGNDEAKARLRDALNGVVLYYHAGPNLGKEYIWVGLTDLIPLDVISAITLHTKEIP